MSATESRDDLEEMIEAAVAVFRDSGLFSDVRAAFDPADLRAEIQLTRTREQTPWYWDLVRLASVGLIPTPMVTENYSVSTLLRAPSGDEISTIEREAAVTTWIGWVFLPASPFWGPARVGRNVQRELVADTLAGTPFDPTDKP